MPGHFKMVLSSLQLFYHFLSILTYGTAQFKLDRTHLQHGFDTTRFSFHTRASLRVHTRLMTSNLLCIALVYTLNVLHDARMHVRNAHA